MLKRALIIALSSLTLVACSSDKEIKKESDKETATNAVKEETGVETEERSQAPLTGVAEEEATASRAVAVMVNNHPKARPQSGLSQADVIYEVLAEGDITRFLAIFQSHQPEEIGPVRSARDYYIELARGYDGLFIAHGYSPEAKDMLTGGYIDHLNGMQYDGTLFERASFRKAPHNSYISYKHISEGAEKNDFDMERTPQSLNFSDKGDAGGEAAQSVMVTYSRNQLFNVMYDYNEEEGKYERYSDGEQTIDYNGNVPVLVKNLFIVETDHTLVDDKGRRDIDLESGGDAYLMQEGKLRKVQWKNIDGRILPYENDQPVSFLKGSTWINIIPSSPGLTGAVSYQQ
ncbi:DUF3048 domain-containing protein [Bacillus sp. KH172YL63]|uniref:DUF3048 domain-containing protein n=1 Tax=Bacillus sp. KH172YL63 TaxID=2709784 RepID=UPI0013E4DE8D|nr:DUF3048 domain-containing protein [Bacillus sp. KH172YL63]BCB02208.1 putative lipoprotein YerB [Bacillus sp. KH172YL63]